MIDEKLAALLTPLQEHQQRTVDKLKASGGVLAIHGLGSGKCARGHTPVLTNRGLLPLSDLFPDTLGVTNTEVTLAGDGLKVVSLVAGQWQWTRVRARYMQRLPDNERTIRVETLRGHVLDVTQAHALPVVRNGELQWVPAANIVVDDWLVVPATLPSTPSVRGISSERAELLAWQIGEGWESSKKATCVITQYNETVLVRLQRLFRKLHPTSASGRINTKKQCLTISSVDYQTALARLGYHWGFKSKNKRLPATFILWPLNILRVAIRALFDAEGSVGPSNVELTSKSKRLIQQIAYALLRFGVRSATHRKVGRATNSTMKPQTYWRLSISGEDYSKFFEEKLIGYDHKIAAKKIKKTNSNIGIPIAWFLRELEAMDLPRKRFGITGKQYCSCNRATAIEASRELLRQLTQAEQPLSKRLGGTAAKFAARTRSALLQHRDRVLSCIAKLKKLVALPVRFEPVRACSPSKAGGYVYDLSVDTPNYQDQNYIAGQGGMLMHNTLTSIAAGDQLGLPLDAVVPAPLVPNYEKELNKHLGAVPDDARVRSYDQARKEQDVNPNALVVLDEAHKLRNVGTGVEQEVGRRARLARARILLSGSPVYNQATDIAPLLNIAAGRNVVPQDPAMFKSMFVGEKRLEPGFIDRLRGVEGAVVPVLKNRDRLIRAATGYVDVHKGGGKDFPRRVDESIDVGMSPEQWEMYQFHEGKMPWHIKAKLRSGLPVSKSESKDLNAFSGALRQTSNTIRPYKTDLSDEDEALTSPKLRRIVEDMVAARKGNPNHRGVIYSNYLDGGLLPLSRMLHAQGVEHGLFHGGINKKERGDLVNRYNAGKLPLLLLSGSGSEGLDLKGTRDIAIAEPHWNNERINQVIGRGIRFKSHEGMPDAEREVRVRKYYSEPPHKMLGKVLEWAKLQKRNKGIERYMQDMSDLKSNLSTEIMDAMQEASDKGPLRKAASTPEELLRAMPGSELGPSSVRYRHPMGPMIEAPFDEDFVRGRQVNTEQLLGDMDNAGYTALNKLDKANRKRREAVGAVGTLFGMPAGALLYHLLGAPRVTRAIDSRIAPKSPGFALGLHAITRLGLPSVASMAGGAIGKQIALAKMKDKTPEETRVRLQHPELQAPREVKLKSDVRIGG